MHGTFFKFSFVFFYISSGERTLAMVAGAQGASSRRPRTSRGGSSSSGPALSNALAIATTLITSVYHVYGENI